MTVSTPELSVIIPAYNEESIIKNSVRQASAYLEASGLACELIVVCDGCKDNTVPLARKGAGTNRSVRVIERAVNMGKGFSVRHGCLEAKGRRVFFMDADLSTPMEEIESLSRWLDRGYDIVIGSRAIEGANIRIRQIWYRETMGKIFNLFVRALAVSGFKDTQCGFKGFTKEAARDLFGRQTINGFGFDVEILYIAQKLGYRIKEVPVRWMNRKESKVNPLTHPFQMLTELVRIRFLDWKGAYDR